MKDDAIRRQAAVSGISDLLMLELKGERLPTYNEVYRAIYDLPSVEAEPVRHGKWLSDNDAFKRMYLVCSLCKRATKIPWYVGGFLYDYCPNCGAKMEGEKNEQ